MGKKIFVTYKYGDTLVNHLPTVWFEDSKVRDYVDVLQSEIEKYSGHINKGEQDGEDLSDFKDSTIQSKLRDKIYDSSVTIIMISKGMKEINVLESDQWIPWEVSYSLRESTRAGRTSLTNALLAVVVPDENNSYSYFMESNSICNSITYKLGSLFNILAQNMFNIKNPNTRECNDSIIHEGHHSYIHCVKWDQFISDPNYYIEIAVQINEKRDDYEIYKSID